MFSNEIRVQTHKHTAMSDPYVYFMYQHYMSVLFFRNGSRRRGLRKTMLMQMDSLILVLEHVGADLKEGRAGEAGTPFSTFPLPSWELNIYCTSLSWETCDWRRRDTESLGIVVEPHSKHYFTWKRWMFILWFSNRLCCMWYCCSFRLWKRICYGDSMWIHQRAGLEMLRAEWFAEVEYAYSNDAHICTKG